MTMLIPQLQVHPQVGRCLFVVLVVLVPQVQILDNVVDMPGFFFATTGVHGLIVLFVQKPEEIPQLQIVENVVDMPRVCNDGVSMV